MIKNSSRAYVFIVIFLCFMFKKSAIIDVLFYITTTFAAESTRYFRSLRATFTCTEKYKIKNT